MFLSRLIIVSFIMITGIFASFFGGNISYALFYLSLIIPIISFLYTFYVYMRLKMYQTIENRTVVKGEVTNYIFQVANEDILSYQNIKINFYQDKSRILGSEEVKEYSLLPGEKQSMDTYICCNYIGEYFVGAETVTITDFLYLFTITYPVYSKMKVWVVPRILKLSNLNLISANSDSKQQSIISTKDEEEVDCEVRKYVRGDNKKFIHWKASAKKQELLTRKNISIPKNGVTVYMDISKIKEDELNSFIIKDKILESTLAISNYCLHKHIPCKVLFIQDKIQSLTIMNQQEFDYFYQKCVGLRFSTNKPIDEVIAKEESPGTSNNSLNHSIIITHEITENLYKSLLPITRSGKEYGIVYINDNMTPEKSYLKKLMIEAGICVTKINLNDEVADVIG